MSEENKNPIEIGGGRDNKGKFAKGNSLSRGKHNVQFIEKARELKKALINAISDKDITAIVEQLAKEAKNGNIAAAREIFDRIWGKAPQEVDIGENTRKTIFDILAVCGLNNDNGD